MSYTVGPYIVSIDALSKAIGSKDRALAVAVLKRRAEEEGEPFDESAFDDTAPIDEDEAEEADEDWDSWNMVAAVKALVNGDLDDDKISGSQYGYALETICAYLGNREFIESLEDVRFSGDFGGYWPWLSGDDKPLVPFNDYNGDFPFIGYLPLADIPAEIQRTKELEFAETIGKSMDVETAIRNKAQFQAELEVFSSEYETATVSPEDFPWLDESYYDSVQQELESLGFRKVRDGERLHLSRLYPETRHFHRLFVNEEEDICATVSQVRIVDPQNDEQRSVDVRCVEFESEFSDGTFFITANTLGVHELENIDGILFENFLPDTPVRELLDDHRKSRETLQQYVIKSEFRKNATLDELIEADKRQQAFLRADRQKKVDESYTGIDVTNEEPDDELNEWLEEIRTEMLALYEKAVESKKDIVTFYY